MAVKQAKKKTPQTKKSVKGKAKSEFSNVPFVVGFGLMALISLLAVFGASGVALDWLASLFKGGFGAGFFVMPIVFGFCAWLFFKISDGLKRRVVCALLVPLAIGAAVHIFSFDGAYEGVKRIIEDGLVLKSGGLFAGGIASLFSAAFSKVGAGIIILSGLTVLVFSSLNISPALLIEYFISRAEPEDYNDYDDDEEYEEDSEDEFEEPPVGRDFDFSAPPRRRSNIDVPLDNNGMPSKNVKKVKTEGLLPPFKIEETVDQGLMDIYSPAKTAPVKEKPAVAETIHTNEKPGGKPGEPFNGEAVDLDREVKKTYSFPPVTLLQSDAVGAVRLEATEETKRNSVRLTETLKSFGVDAKIINVTRGPSVTRYEVQLSRGTKYSKLTSLSDDIALALAAQAVRIAPIPDKVAVGIEVPNRNVNLVHLRDVIESPGFNSAKSRVSFAMGRDIAGDPVIGDIAKLPHLLVAGTTGSGKSVCINSILISILYKAKPSEVRFIMVDPKMIELGVYNGIPHLLIPVVTDPKKAAGALQWALGEMMKRYKKMRDAGVRDIFGYNAWLTARHVAGDEQETEFLPQIVIVIDELADLMLVAAGEVEEAVCRLAQMARAAGMHLIIATQRPSADVITGIMKANIPSRIAFAVASQLESRIILDTMGAEKLIGRGDMLFNPIGSTKPVRVQGCFISSEEVEAVVGYVKTNHEADYNEEVIEQVERAAEQEMGGKKSGNNHDFDDTDVIFDDAVQVIMDTGQASASMLQRRLKLGYARASRLIDQMDERGIIGPFEGSKPRTILISKQDWQEMLARRDYNE